MSFNIKLGLGTATSITCTTNSLGSSATVGRESTVIDNTTNLFLDALVEVVISFPNSAPGSDKAVYVYAYASVDGTNYTEVATGSDAAYTMRSPTTLRLLGTIPIPTQNINYRSAPMSVGAAFGGVLPPKWGLVIRNYAGQSLNGSGNSQQYRGVYTTVG